MTEQIIDTLPEFHLQHPDDAVYALIAHLISILEEHKESDIKVAWQNVSNILGEIEANRILHVICRIDHVDYLQLMEDCQADTNRRVSPRLLLHLAILPVTFVSSQLQIDHYWAAKLLEQFHKHFTIDNPILWLKHYLTITEQERLRYGHAKEDLLLGRAVTNAPVDTAEERRVKRWHRLRPDLFPPGAH